MTWYDDVVGGKGQKRRGRTIILRRGSDMGDMIVGETSLLQLAL